MKIQKIEQFTGFLSPLAHIPQIPQRLWLRGHLPPDRKNKVVAIVGSRKSTSYGEQVAYRLARDLAKYGVIIVSGMAYGIDGKAHAGCLDAGGTTLAVFGTAIDRVYPARNFTLAQKILEQGAILSEYAVGAETGNWSFLERNRLVSGLADILVVVEAATRSGTLATAAFALDQGKTVFAVPGNITSPMSQGCNNLIKQGALPLTSSEDCIKLLFPDLKRPVKRPIIGDTPLEAAILKQLQDGEQDGEVIAEKAHLSVSEFNQAISLLEIKGLTSSQGFNHWVLT